MSRRIALRDVNWLGDGDLAICRRTGRQSGPASALRSRRSRRRCFLDGGGVTVRLHEGENGISPGQACVLYDSDAMRARVLGGGWIRSAERD